MTRSPVDPLRCSLSSAKVAGGASHAVAVAMAITPALRRSRRLVRHRCRCAGLKRAAWPAGASASLPQAGSGPAPAVEASWRIERAATSWRPRSQSRWSFFRARLRGCRDGFGTPRGDPPPPNDPPIGSLVPVSVTTHWRCSTVAPSLRGDCGSRFRRCQCVLAPHSSSCIAHACALALVQSAHETRTARRRSGRDRASRAPTCPHMDG